MNDIALHVDEAFLAKKAKKINDLTLESEQVGMQYIEYQVRIGAEFAEARGQFPLKGSHRPGWWEWVKENAHYSKAHASKLIRIYEKLGPRLMSGASSRMSLGIETANFLARKQTPKAALEAALKEAESTDLTLDRAKEITKAHLPTAAQARKIARDTGRLTVARDGYIYSGATIDEEQAYSERSKLVYYMLDAIEHIAACPVTPKAWIEAAEEEWIFKFDPKKVEVSIKWLTAMVPVLKKRLKEINDE